MFVGIPFVKPNLKVLINFSSEILLVPFKTEISFSCKLANSKVTSAGANA
jgi:hypothetical protein